MSTDPSPVEAPVRGRLIAFRADRLGARLVSLMNAMRLAEDYNAGFACAWTDTTGVGHVFNDPTELFKMGFVKHNFLDADEWRSHKTKCEPLTGQMQQAPTAVTEALDGGQDLIVGNAFGIICLAGEDKIGVTERFRAQFGRIPFAPPVAEAMRSLDAALQGFTAYHIRRGDLTGDLKAMNKPWPHKMVPNEFYEIHIRETLRNEAAGVVLFSDDAETIAHYSALFPELRTVANLIELASLTEAQRDLIELYAMSRCQTIIAPQRSAFSSTASDLSGAEKIDVTDCLSDEDRAAAHQALFERLRDRPETFAGPGEIGQCLAHIGPWLEEAERWDDAANLFSDHVANGLNISFIYPRTMEYQHRIGDIDGVLGTAKHMRSRSVVHVKDQAAAEILHGYAHLRQSGGENASGSAGLRHIANGFWHAPTIPSARSVVPFLMQNGILNDKNFLPSSPTLRGLLLKRGPLKAMFLDFPDLVGMPGMVLPQSIFSVEPILLDWAPLMRALSINAEVRRGTVQRIASAVSALPDDPDTEIERASLLALYRAFASDPETAVEELEDMAAMAPDDAMVLQRLSHAQRIARSYGPAADTAQQAVQLRPDLPFLQAWAGMSLIRTRKYELAAVHLKQASSRDLGFASIHSLYSEALQRMDQPEEALGQIRRALDLAPLEVDYALRIARILEHLNRPDESIAHLVPVVEAERAPAKLFILLIDLLEKTGKSSDAREMAAEALRRSPDHPALAELADRHAA